MGRAIQVALTQVKVFARRTNWSPYCSACYEFGVRMLVGDVIAQEFGFRPGPSRLSPSVGLMCCRVSEVEACDKEARHLDGMDSRCWMCTHDECVACELKSEDPRLRYLRCAACWKTLQRVIRENRAAGGVV